MTTHHKDRLQAEMQRALSEILWFNIQDPRIRGLTLRRVSMTGDLRVARIYYDTTLPAGEREPLHKALEKAKGFLRREISGRLRMRVVPELEFYEESV